MAPYTITGCKGGIQPRLEIRDLQKDTKQFTLFVLAFNDVKRANYETAAARFVEIAGIHGLPYSQWPGDPDGKSKGNPGEDGQWGGYCHHASVLFPTWHRPYVLALEQTISEAAHEIAGRFALQYPAEAAVWRDAATKLRFPFWDWTLPDTGTQGLPNILKVTSVQITMPEGKIISAPNPIAHYDFQGALPKGFTDVEENNPLLPKQRDAPPRMAYFSKWTRTYRWPSSTPNNPAENYSQIDKILKGEAVTPDGRGRYQDLINNVIDMFSFPLESPPDWSPYIWDKFSNTTVQTEGLAPLPSVAGSIEHPHNTVHLLLGGIGDMGDNDYAGFDPIFFLHHCQVDRLLSFWETIYPDYWMGLGYKNKEGQMQPFIQEDGTWSELPNAGINENTILDPFRREVNSYWAAKETRFMSHGAMNYTYPPIQGVEVVWGEPLRLSLRAKYLAVLQRHFSMDPHLLLGRHVALKPKIFTDDVRSKVPGGYAAVHGFRHFAFRVELLEFAFNSSYYIEFLYQKTEDTTVPVGIVPVLGRGSNTRCAACNTRRVRGNKIKGVVTIDTNLVVDIVVKEGLNHPDTTHEQVIDALKKNIWASLATPEGGRIASARHGAAAHGRRPLPTEAIPKIVIASANVAEREGEDEGNALSYYDDAQHGEHLTQGWGYHDQ
ncbi:Di-copper centre-containing protein [Mycena metata]|uniref:tyrosinase n=1 Tax=Mycena metata TaxID=1033252 RepID=A0AAD7IFW3_9AGAR|nr:Di-copper centre-containing protein [Mycena metata]